MSPEDPDREIARLFAEQRRADEASAPALPELMSRPHRMRMSRKRSLARIALIGATAAAIATVILLRPARSRDGGQDAALPPAAAQLASWKAPTDSLLRTPGSELWTRVPVLVSRAAPEEPAHPVQTTKGVGE
jgi:hypothetical protein